MHRLEVEFLVEFRVDLYLKLSAIMRGVQIDESFEIWSIGSRDIPEFLGGRGSRMAPEASENNLCTGIERADFSFCA